MSDAITVFLYRYGELALLDNYVKVLTRVGFSPVIDRDCGKADACSALLLPGGDDSDPALYGQENHACRGIDRRRDEAELFLTRRFAALGKPILGICRGHQLLNIAFGGDLWQDLSTKEAHCRKEGRDQLHDTVILPGSGLAAVYGGSARVTSAHHQGVHHLGRGFRAVQWTEDGVIEGAEHQTLPILGVQWHPERQAFDHRPADASEGAKLFWEWKKKCGV